MPADQDYLAAVDKGDTGGAQAMVDQAAKKAGHKGPYFHGSPNTGEFSKFDVGRAGMIYFSESKGFSEDFGSVKPFYLKSKKVFDFANNPEHREKAIELFNSRGGWKDAVELNGAELEEGRSGYLYDRKRDNDWEIFDEAETDILSDFIQEGFDEFVFRDADSKSITHAVLDPSQIKSAEPVTRDDDGNVIPLSERFNPGEDDFNYMPATATDAVAKQVGERPKLGVNINSGKIPFGDMIIKGLKTIETRRDLSRNGLRRPSKTGETIALVSTFGGGKQAEIIGTAKVGEPVEYNTLKEFRADYKKHRVEPGSEYDWDGYKVGYPLKEVKPLSKPVPVPKGTPGSPMHKNLDGVNYMPAGRAKAGGEVGLNRDFYKGGQFLPSTEMPKRDRAKIEKQASGKEHFERGYGKENWAIPEPYKAPLLRWYSTFMNDAHMDYLTREGTPMEYIKTMEDFRKRFESGERWIDIREYPEFAQPNDLARLFKAGLPIPEASFDKLDHLSAVKSMRKHSKKATGDEANLMPATEADSRIPSRVPAKPVVSNRSPMLQWLAQSFIEKGLIDKEDWDTAVNALSPIDAKRSQIPDAFKVGQVNQNYPMVLDSVKQEKFVDVLLGEGPKEGTSVGLRIDIKAFENSLKKVASGELDFPVYVVTIHSEGSAKGIGKDIEGYSAIAAVSNPTFLIGSEKGSLGIAAGKRKTTLATVEGEWVPLSEVPNVTGEGWTMVGMDPTRHSYFYDKASGQPIKGGSLAISFGNTVFVRDAIPMTPEEASGVLYMPAKEVGGSTVYKGEEGARVIKTKSGKYRVYGANKALLGIASSQKMADRILQRGTKKVSIRKRPSRGLAGVGGS